MSPKTATSMDEALAVSDVAKWKYSVCSRKLSTCKGDRL